uniref:DNA 3'-5' helicase n=1 Tax=Megaviridae environmental sample TaxID=1737588 RepID=A0A5J6VJU3_9VIRU|nr:MAG: UvrD/REP helicase N-terminal domain protein [Megaviridae environmental sample]
MTLIEKKEEIIKQIYMYKKEILDLELSLSNIDTQLEANINKNILNTFDLNENQKKIVYSTEKNILVIACPGSGKTHTIISRYIYLVTHKNINPDDIILITFTKKAGNEMLERINKLIPNKSPYYVGSLHGLGYKILKETNNINYTVIDEIDSKTMLLDLVDENTMEYSAIIKKYIWDIYNLSCCNYPNNVDVIIKNFKLNKFKKEIKQILKKYKCLKKEQNLIDYNDLMILFANQITKKKMESFIDKIKYVFFDEYQDINSIQNYILQKFVKSNIMVVGDDAQSIYSFRGSSIDYILNFSKNNTDTVTYYLDVNYRSTPSIINIFSNIINKNNKQLKKNIKPYNENTTHLPKVIEFISQKDQYEWILKDIKNKKDSGATYNDIVILARNNSSIDAFELEAIKYNIPISKNIGNALLTKDYIKDFLAFVIILINSKSLIHWKRILSLHNLNVSESNELLNNLKLHDSNICKSLQSFIDGNKNIDQYSQLRLLNNLLLKCSNSNNNLCYIKNYLEKIWLSENIQDIEDRLSDIDKLIIYFNNNDISEFITNLYLNTELENKYEETLYLTTIHGAKGLEWDYVYLIDLTSNIFPNIKTQHYTKQLEEMEEERRIFYVGMSRAKKNIFLTYYQILNTSNKIYISPFLLELDENLYTTFNMNRYKQHFTGKISSDINLYIKSIGFTFINNILKSINYSKEVVSTKNDISHDLTDLPNKLILNKFFHFLTIKIIQNNFRKEFENLNLNLYYIKNNFRQDIYHKFIDKNEHWMDILELILYIATFNLHLDITIYEKILLSDSIKQKYINFEKNLISYFKKYNFKNIKNNININYKAIKTEIPLLIDDHLIDIRTTYKNTFTVQHILQLLIQGYILKKNNYEIKKVSMYNLLNGYIETIDVTNFNFLNLKKIIYNIN